MADTTWWETIKIEGDAVLEKLKAIVHEGNVRRIRIQHQGRTVAEFPVTAGVLAIVLAPAAAAIGAMVAVLQDCTIQVEREQQAERGAGTASTEDRASA